MEILRKLRFWAEKILWKRFFVKFIDNNCSPLLGTLVGVACYPQVPDGHPRLSIVGPLRGLLDENFVFNRFGTRECQISHGHIIEVSYTCKKDYI